MNWIFFESYPHRRDVNWLRGLSSTSSEMKRIGPHRHHLTDHHSWEPAAAIKIVPSGLSFLQSGRAAGAPLGEGRPRYLFPD